MCCCERDDTCGGKRAHMLSSAHPPTHPLTVLIARAKGFPPTGELLFCSCAIMLIITQSHHITRGEIMNNLSFTVLGPSGCGKTTLLACMNNCFSSLMPANFETSDTQTFSLLTNAFTKLEHDAHDNGDSLFFTGGIEGTDTDHVYTFTVKAGRTTIPLKFTDFPGEWLDPRDPDNSQKYSQVETIARESSVIIAVIDTPCLMQRAGKYANSAAISEIEHVIENSLTDDGKLILLVPVKCERYLENDADAEALRSTIRTHFSRTISLAGESSSYFGRAAVAILPVKTMGNVMFARFEEKEGRTLQVYRRIIGRTFNPEYTDQPLRYAMSFLLEQYRQKRKTSLLGRMFMSTEVERVITSLREGISTNIPGCEVFGRSVLGIKEEQ